MEKERAGTVSLLFPHINSLKKSNQQFAECPKDNIIEQMKMYFCNFEALTDGNKAQNHLIKRKQTWRRIATYLHLP